MTDTTNLGLHRPAAGDASWDVPLNQNADTLDALFAASGGTHDHSGAAGHGQKLSQANTHQSPDTDGAPTSLHHTLGTGANQAAAGNHTHSGYAQTANNLSDLASAATARTNLGLGTAATHATGDYEPALGNPGTDGYVLSSTAAGVRSWAAPGMGGGGDPATATHGATGKATPVDADELPLVDSAASYALKKLTWANLKATLKSYFDTLYAAVTHTHAAADLTSGTIAPARLGSGTADSTTILYGDSVYRTAPSGGTNGSPAGLTGATAATRYAGATASGAPTTGTFAVGDFVVDQTGKVWICTTAGTPGTWTQVGAAVASTAFLFPKRFGQIAVQYNQATLAWVNFNATFGTVDGTAASFPDAYGDWLRYRSGAVSGNKAGVLSGTGSYDSRHTPSIAMSFYLGQTTVLRCFAGFGAADPTSATPNNTAAWRYDTGVDGTTFWRTYTSNGSAQTVTTTTVAVATSNPPVLRVDLTASDCKFYADDVLIATHTTTLPVAGTVLNALVRLTTLEAVLKDLFFNRLQVLSK